MVIQLRLLVVKMIVRQLTVSTSGLFIGYKLYINVYKHRISSFKPIIFSRLK